MTTERRRWRLSVYSLYAIKIAIQYLLLQWEKGVVNVLVATLGERTSFVLVNAADGCPFADQILHEVGTFDKLKSIVGGLR